MHFPTIFTSSLAILPSLVSAHGDSIPGLPKVFGLRGLNVNGFKSRNVFSPRTVPEQHSHDTKLATRKTKKSTGNTSDQCGDGFGSCADGYCCSPEGWCGLTEDYCAAPDCQINYGTGCDANKSPPGATTAGDTRTKTTSPKILYGGAGIYGCTVPGTIALTFDDGPYIYTSHILDVFDQYNATGTFFITGNNLGKGEIDDSTKPWAAMIQRMYATGHQIASHTWSHQDLSLITDAQRQSQIIYNEMAIRNILGVYPTYMRPPYSSCTTACQTLMAKLGYHVVYFDLDTEDYLYPNNVQVPMNDFSGNLSTGNNPAQNDWLVISHDIQPTTSATLVDYMLKTLIAAGFKPVTVGECLGDPKANWYRTSAGALYTPSANASTASSTAASTAAASKTSSVALPTKTASADDSTCGPASGNTCLGSGVGNCCSVNGWCGSTSDYCGTGCQSLFGNCGSNGGSSTGTNATTTSAGAVSTSLAVSGDGSCGAASGQTCSGSAYGNCCSQYGWCGSDADHCTNSQAAYGNSNSTSSVASSSSKLSTSSVATVLRAVTSSGSSTKSVSSSGLVSSSVQSSSVSSPKVSSASTAASSSANALSSSATSSKPSSASSTLATTSSAASTKAASSSSTLSTKAASSSSTLSSKTSSSLSASSTALKASTDGTCGGTSGFTCTGSTKGTCCLQAAGATTGACFEGVLCTVLTGLCQKGFGTC